jgi:hypothetical protein
VRADSDQAYGAASSWFEGLLAEVDR